MYVQQGRVPLPWICLEGFTVRQEAVRAVRLDANQDAPGVRIEYHNGGTELFVKTFPTLEEATEAYFFVLDQLGVPE